MHNTYHSLIGSAAKIVNLPSPLPILSYSPVVLTDSTRTQPLQLRVTFPPLPPSTSETTAPLPIILLSHGQGRSNSLSSLEGYAPLAEFWAAHGFAVLQPTHLSSRFLGLTPTSPGQELFWQERAKDMTRILDNLDFIEDSVPGLGLGSRGGEGGRRLNRDRVAVAGHSAGAWTASMLLGASNTDPRDGSRWTNTETRIKAGAVLAGLGNGGEANLSENGRTALIPFFGGDFSTMTTPTLVVYGDEDVSPHLSVRGADWHADPYTHSNSGPKAALLTLKGAKHGLGGISGWDAGETMDESPERLGIVQRMTWAYFRSRLFENDRTWEEAKRSFELHEELRELGMVESKD